MAELPGFSFLTQEEKVLCVSEITHLSYELIMQVNGVTNILASKHVFHPHGHSSAMARISPGGGGSQGEVRATVRTLRTPWLLECGAPSGRSTVSGRGTARREARPEDVHRSGIFQLRNVYKIRLCFSSDIKPKKRNTRNESEWIGNANRNKRGDHGSV